MKTYKKIGIGLSLLIAVVAIHIFTPSHTLAACAAGETCGGGVVSTKGLTAADLSGAIYKVINAGEIDATLKGSVVQFFDSNPTNSPYNFKPKDTSLFCDGTTYGHNGLADKLKGINLEADFNSIANSGGTSIPGLLNLDYYDSAGACQNLQANVTFTQQADGSVTTATPCGGGADCVNGACTKTGGDCTSASATSTTPTCASNFSTGFEWVMCPALSMADDAANGFNSFVENQMCFNTGSVSSTNGVVCQGNNNLNDSVKTAWGVFKNIATALLVIVMLVMVISQAVGGGPFDAYTVRKMLPKLVAAVILMQLSWVLFKWTIDLSNDMGVGIRNLLSAPFHGTDGLQLDKLVGANLNTHTTGTNNTFALFTAVAAGAGLLAISLPGLAILAFYAVMALLVAFIVFVFRKLLIILLVIMAPIALICWVLPGADRYWKLWSDNFTKLLVMFPMIMALITAGRIFAYVTAGNTSSGTIFIPRLAIAHLGPLPVPYVASVTSFVDFAIIIVAYFGPYFLLPQTFKWGGTAISAASKGVKSGMEKGTKPAKDYLDWRKGMSRWSQARSARKSEVERQAHHNFYEGLARGGIRGSYRRAQLGGVGDPRNEERLRGRIRQSAETELDKARHEDIQRATTELTQRVLPQFDQSSQDDVREAIATGKTLRVQRADGTMMEFDGAEYARTHEQGQRAALDRALIHGQMGVIDQYYTEAMRSGDQGRITEATRFKDDNAQALGTKLTHVLKGHGVAVQATSGEIAEQSGHEVESIIAHQTSLIAAGRLPGATPQQIADANEAATNLSGYLARHRQARADPSTRGRVDLRGTRAVDAYAGALTGDANAISYINEVNNGANHPVTGTRFGPDGRLADREANRSRYRTPGAGPPGTTPRTTIPDIIV